MKTSCKIKAYMLFALLLCSNFAHSQLNNARENALRIFYDCDICDEEFIKKELTYVNYVRDSKEAQVHILVTYESTGNGGNKYSFFFIGQLEFKGQKDTLAFFTKADATNDEVRQKQLQTMKLGLMRYVAKTPIASNIEITYKVDEKESDVVKDKWNSWVFDVNLNGYFNGQKLYKYTSLNSSFDVSRVTPELKVNFDVSYSYDHEVYGSDTDRVVVTRKSKYFENMIVKSLNDHWSVGYIFSINSSYYSNYNFHSTIAPAIEYNIFPYTESSRRQIRILYRAGWAYSNYIDTTIYFKLKESRLFHRLSVTTEFKEKWGSLSVSLYGSHYFHNIKYNNIGLNTSINLRIIKGLSLRLYGGISLIHDQINLRKKDYDYVDMLTQQREFESQYRYYGSVGLTYTFGSIYNNVVNPRFGN